MTRANRYPRAIRRGAIPSVLLIAAAVCLSGCGGDDGNGPTPTGTVSGIIYLPFDLVAALQPASGATVLLSAADYDTTVTSQSDGTFFVASVPEGTVTLSASLGTCMAYADTAITVTDGDTTDVAVYLGGSESSTCLALPYAGAARMEIDPTTNRAVLLYDNAYVTSPRTGPALVVVDLATGQVTARELSDLEDVYDLAFTSADEVVFNFKSTLGHGLRFYDIAAMAPAGSDIIFDTDLDYYPGRLAVDDQRAYVFVTIGRPGFPALGKVYAFSVEQRVQLDADNDPFNPDFAFDNDLVSGSLEWAYNIAYDPVAHEILVGNRYPAGSPFLTAIDWSDWGEFDRDANLSIPTPGVRKVLMNPGTAGFAVEYWDFAGGTGVAAKGLSAMLAAASYTSGGNAYTTAIAENTVELVSDNQFLTVVPRRETWFALVGDSRRPEAVRIAVEERELSTLTLHNRYETRFAQLPPYIPRAFAVNLTTERLYVAYRAQAILEVFDLCRGEECGGSAKIASVGEAR